MKNSRNLTYYEFFAGGGLARLGLGAGWRCLFANDVCPKKGRAYKKNFGPADELVVGDINNVTADMLPKGADLAWASFPCQDLSLAGGHGGIHASRSGTFWSFGGLIRMLDDLRRPVPLLVVENVVGLVTSGKGGDLREVLSVLEDIGYRVGPLVLDAARFLPQSRPRLFIVCVLKGRPLPEAAVSAGPDPLWHPKSLVAAYGRMPRTTRRSWVWWSPPAPGRRTSSLKDLVETDPQGVEWHTREETAKLLAMMSPRNRRKLEEVRDKGVPDVGAVYKRTRKDGDGNGAQRAEARFDGMSGCLRTPAGGSSRQIILTVDGGKIRSRLLSPREAARLMGVPDSYALPERRNEAYRLMGDGLAVPAVSWLERHILRPVAARGTTAAAGRRGRKDSSRSPRPPDRPDASGGGVSPPG